MDPKPWDTNIISNSLACETWIENSIYLSYFVLIYLINMWSVEVIFNVNVTGKGTAEVNSKSVDLKQGFDNSASYIYVFEEDMINIVH